MNAYVKTISLLLSSIVTTACFNASTVNADRLTDLKAQAPFDLNCDQVRVKYTPLVTRDDGVITSYGVDGCDKRVSYKLVTGKWFADVASTDAHASSTEK